MTKANYDLILVDVDRVSTVIHRMNVVNGDYLMPIILKGMPSSQVVELYRIIERDKPTKIIFDKNGVGIVFHEAFFKTHMHQAYGFRVDPFGTIWHEEEYKRGV